MAVDPKAGAYPALAVARPTELVERARGRVHAEIGEAVANALFRLYGERRSTGLGLDSPTVRETLAARVVEELGAAGYTIRWTGRGS